MTLNPDSPKKTFSHSKAFRGMTAGLLYSNEVSRKSAGFHHAALGYILMHLIVQVFRQCAVIPEMGQHFQINCKKSQIFKNFLLVRSLDDDKISMGQVTKLALTQKNRWGTDPVRWSRSLMYLMARLGVVRRFEWSTVRQITSGSLPSSGMLAIR
ncbi:hypothetical protein TNCV_1359801 [Trichonephila clavipes]|nr:hypothetical protein TNCV_1359801 [Trichonephila clavipes]